MYFIFFSVITSIILNGCNSKASEVATYAVKINNEQVSKNEFMLYLYEAQKNFESVGGNDIWETDFDGQTAEEAAKESALNALKMVKITAQRAKELKINLTDEGKKKAKSEAKSSYAGYSEEEKKAIGLSEDEIYNIMQEKYLFNNVYDEIVKNYEVSEADFNAYYKDNKDKFKSDYTMLNLKAILVNDKSVADEVYTKAKAGEDFSKLVNTYTVGDELKSTGGVLQKYKGEIEDYFGVKFDIEVGGISEILEVDEGYYIIKLESKQEADESDIISNVKGYYTAAKKQTIFNQEYNKWQNEAKIVKNNQVWEQIKIIR